MNELQTIVAALLSPSTGPSVLATLVRVEGSSYRRPGARLLVKACGQRIGSISGGCLEADVVTRASRIMETGVPEAVVYDTTTENDLVWGVGLGCHGIVTVLLERLAGPPAWAAQLSADLAERRSTRLAVRHAGGDTSTWGTHLEAEADRTADRGLFLQTIPPPPALAVFGAGDDAQPLARLGRELGWHTTVADPRQALATKERFPEADRTVSAATELLVAQVAPEAGSLAVVMTHHYIHDVPLLRALLPRPLAYLGLLGPRKRAERILADLEKTGFLITPAMRERLHAPVGLDLGADSPDQVALAIMAEMLSVLSHRDARPLRDRIRPIHEVLAAQEP